MNSKPAVMALCLFIASALDGAASEPKPTAGVLVQVRVGTPGSAIEIKGAYQRGSQVFIQFGDAPGDPAITVPRVWIDVLDMDLPGAATLLTREAPQESDRILYEGVEKLADFVVDPDNPWVYSAEFSSEINILHYPWVFLPGHGYLFLYPFVPAVSEQSLPFVQANLHTDARWIYSHSLGFLNRVTFGSVWPTSTEY